MHILDTLKERGFLAQITYEEDLYKRLEQEPITFYIGFDPTAPSLHWGVLSKSWQWRICSMQATCPSLSWDAQRP